MTRWETYLVHHVTPFVPSRLRLEGVRGEERPILPLSPRTCRWSLGPHWGVVTSFGVRRITNFNKLTTYLGGRDPTQPCEHADQVRMLDLPRWSSVSDPLSCSSSPLLPSWPSLIISPPFHYSLSSSYSLVSAPRALVATSLFEL